MKDTQKYGLSPANSEAWHSQSSGFTYRTAAQRHPMQPTEPAITRKAQKNQNSYPEAQAIDVAAIEVEAIGVALEMIEMEVTELQRMAYESQPASSEPDPTPTPAQNQNTNANPGLLDIGFWLNLPE
ncbi:MAG: hypothetical protein HY785_29455 [Oscillatoriophycideae cyanobacterium NC_groundwater_1537_Pr4_S-0.65um_50_18]|nr:hypothetical protein [Oscillatoriophycideae cyanobacterium NC_groundwater_1537_Pr4_S-0.65um_50_18]